MSYFAAAGPSRATVSRTVDPDDDPDNSTLAPEVEKTALALEDGSSPAALLTPSLLVVAVGDAACAVLTESFPTAVKVGSFGKSTVWSPVAAGAGGSSSTEGTLLVHVLSTDVPVSDSAAWSIDFSAAVTPARAIVLTTVGKDNCPHGATAGTTFSLATDAFPRAERGLAFPPPFMLDGVAAGLLSAWQAAGIPAKTLAAVQDLRLSFTTLTSIAAAVSAVFAASDTKPVALRRDAAMKRVKAINVASGATAISASLFM